MIENRGRQILVNKKHLNKREQIRLSEKRHEDDKENLVKYLRENIENLNLSKIDILLIQHLKETLRKEIGMKLEE